MTGDNVENGLLKQIKFELNDNTPGEKQKYDMLLYHAW